MWVMAVVCGSWWLWVGHGGCVVVVCVSRERYLRILSYVNDFRHPRLTLVQSTTTVIVYHIDSPHITVPTISISQSCP